MAYSLVLGGIVLVLYCATLVVKKTGSGKLGKGPRGLPFVGNLHQVLGAKPFVTFSAWARQFGSVFDLQLGSQRAVVISSIEAAREALVTKGKAFSGRPFFNTMTMLHQQERKFVFAPHCEQMLKLYRKTVIADIRKRSAAIEPIVEQEVDKMAAELFKGDQMETVVDLRNLFHRVAANIAHGYAFGSTFELNDPKLQKWEEALDEYRELLHWFRTENFLPHSHLFLRDFQNQAINFRKNSMGLYKASIAEARRKKAEGLGKETGLMDAILDMFEGEKAMNGESDDDIISILRDVMFGGSDGAYQPLIWMMIYAAKDSHLQEKIQAEINDVIGPECMPTLTDRDSMPYVEATVREVLRHSEVTTLGIPRRTIEDVTIGDHPIPKDTLVIVNVYAIHRDENHWKSPEEFNPQRFLNKSGELISTSELSYLPFSTGHRACVGQNFARNFLFLLFTRFFQQFEVSPAPGEPAPEMINNGGAFNPDVKPFKVLIRRKLWQAY